ncbi:hypothetical protein FH581_017215 (plasmid) [Leptospira weilii]|uniref:hypothetical protein n=1 Tax=Leptospira weilii TaxID=28184 RepID=UPI001EF16EA3|nr:hypothetical protein [Leptospira weilii]ULH29028.1 hypothetical protein FH586_03555 [Leptospira weilii]UPY79920.1 hypothetical protein FH581_018020 [Leptospira weilii]UPY80318.1 hypothetical protein FH581_023820 [Leptospira weilii]UPY80342.1 hypothetical protein FH581_023960 [Leptospira weilii]UPY80840.1 hypothetical protein FH581_022470 [Leptospira weilii]
MIQKYFGRVSFLDRGLLISTVFVLEAKSISQVYQLIQAKFEITEEQILDLKITNRKAIKTHKVNSLKQWMEKTI